MHAAILWIALALIIVVGCLAIFIVIAGGRISNFCDGTNDCLCDDCRCRHGISGGQCPDCFLDDLPCCGCTCEMAPDKHCTFCGH